MSEECTNNKAETQPKDDNSTHLPRDTYVHLGWARMRKFQYGHQEQEEYSQDTPTFVTIFEVITSIQLSLFARTRHLATI